MNTGNKSWTVSPTSRPIDFNMWHKYSSWNRGQAGGFKLEANEPTGLKLSWTEFGKSAVQSEIK